MTISCWEAQISFRRLDRGVAEEEFDLLQIAAILAAEPRTCPPQIVRPKVLNPDLFRGGLDHAPDCPIAQLFAQDATAFRERTQEPTIFDCGFGCTGLPTSLRVRSDRIVAMGVRVVRMKFRANDREPQARRTSPPG